jgi:nitrate reductase cytochrome c-type subunit
MKLATKYNLTLFSTLAVCYVAISATSYYILHRHAKDEVLQHAAMLMEAAKAMRKYTIDEIKPLLALQNKRNFLPQSVPSYAATQNFNALRENNPEYRYKEATLNPTNPRDRAADWEADLIQEFRNKADLKQLIVVRDTPLGKTLYYARPIRIMDKQCLSCHGVIDDAPDTMLKLYGPANGFGWKFEEVVGSQIVSVPLSLPIKRANQSFYILAGVLLAGFLLVFIIMSLIVRKLFINRLLSASKIVEAVNQGNSDRPKFEIRGNDEFAHFFESIEHLCKQQEIANRMMDNTMDFDHIKT